ncbi:MAG: glycosyltransferase family 39 protein [Anaerolineae bacterium]
MVIIALLGRVLLIVSQTVSFHSDEAVVALMARHILQGERPVFFYGQAYMGSLDAWLVAIGFALFGQTVTAIRIVQAVIYLGIVASGYVLAWKITRSTAAAFSAGLLLAIPSVLFATYTSATLGGYGETLLLGNLLLILALDLAGSQPSRPAWMMRWFALGLIAGVGWWTNALIAVYALPALVVLLANPLRSAARNLSALVPVLGGGLIALVGLLIGAAPWWVFALQNNFAPLAFLTGGGTGSGFAGTDVFSLPLDQRLIGFFLLGLPTVFGARFPWFSSYFLAPVGLLVGGIVLLAGYRFFARRVENNGRLLIGVLIIGFSVVYLASRFSFDPTGRYFLPLVMPVAVMVGSLIGRLWARRRIFALLLIGVVIGYQAIGQIVTATTYPGFTTQFNLDTHIPNTDDDALIAFLDEHELYRGYTQYWIAFRLAFLSGERMQYSASLPYLPSLHYTPLDDRIPAYRQAADSADTFAYILANTTPNVEPIRAWLEGELAARQIEYTSAEVGPFTVY